jgi:tRNA(Ile)-lysidine synthase
MYNLVKRIQNISNQHFLWKRGSKIVVGVSGGPDSVCLLDILMKIRKAYALEVIVAHVNYCLRGKDSEADEKFVAKITENYGLKFALLKAGKIGTNNLESRLRDVRYDFFEKVRQENGFDLIAVAHNLDDQAETFLMRVIRGSGLAGLAAMRFRNGMIIRPLLGTKREGVMKYLTENKLRYRTDKTNATDLFFRNRVRNKLVPFLEKGFNPKIKETIYSATTSIAEDEALLDELAQEACCGWKDISVKKILSLHPSLQRRVILKVIESKKANLKDIEAAHIEEILKVLHSTKGKSQVVTFQGLKVTRKGDMVSIVATK